MRGHLLVGGPAAFAVLVLVIAGGVLFAVNKDDPRDFTGFPYLLVPFIGTALLTRANLSAGFTAAVLSLALGYVLGIALTVLDLLAAIS